MASIRDYFGEYHVHQVFQFKYQPELILKSGGSFIVTIYVPPNAHDRDILEKAKSYLEPSPFHLYYFIRSIETLCWGSSHG